MSESRVQDHPGAEMSVIVVIPDRYATVESLMEYLVGQTVRERLELVFVVPDQDVGIPREVLQAFHSWQILEVGTIHSTGPARAQAVRAAKSPLIAITENHSFPDPDWAKALIRAHQGGWVGVGPQVINGNPESVLSRAEYLLYLAPWGEVTSAEPRSSLASHQVSYKRQALLSLDEALGFYLSYEYVLFEEGPELGMNFYLEPAACVSHLQSASVWAQTIGSFHSSRIYGAARAHKWTRLTRCLRALTCPAIPMLVLRRRWSDYRRIEGSNSAVLFWWLVGVSFGAVGEAVGYLAGYGDSREIRTPLEFHR